jgi:MAF protein
MGTHGCAPSHTARCRSGRVEILNGILSLGATVVPSTFPEDLDKAKYAPQEYVVENARRKALEVYERLQQEGNAPPSLVVGADTVVVLDEAILEKPKSVEAAKAMLRSMSGRAHSVATGCALVYAPASEGDEPTVVSLVEQTSVTFAALEASVIDAYVASGEPMDKAGVLACRTRTPGCGAQAVPLSRTSRVRAAGIRHPGTWRSTSNPSTPCVPHIPRPPHPPQGMGGAFVTGIEGCYFNVVGFPMHRFCATLDCDRLSEWVRQNDAQADDDGAAPKRARTSE